MAYFNPTPVTFNPSPIIMEGANAIGRTMQDLYRQNYQEAQDKIKQSQADRMFGLHQNQFDFQKERAGVQDDQWGKTFQAGRDDAQTRSDQWKQGYDQQNTFHNDTVNYQNKQLANSGESLAMQKQQLSDNQEKQRATGLYIADLYPQLADKFGAVIKNQDGTVSYNDKKLAGLAGTTDLAKTKMAIDAKDSDPLKAYYANLAGEKFKETQSKNAEFEKMKKVQQLQKQLADNPKSLLGIDLKNLTEEDYTAFTRDINNGNIGSVKHEAGKFYGTNPRYVPFGNQPSESTTQQKQIVERRQTQDGKILVKYSDGTIGEQ